MITREIRGGTPYYQERRQGTNTCLRDFHGRRSEALKGVIPRG